MPRQNGEVGRLRVVQGADSGATFVLFGSEISLGRGEENDVQVPDLKMSRRHVVLKYMAGGWAFQDQGSANGVMKNGQWVRQDQIRSGDVIQVGETTFEFMSADASTGMIIAPPRTLEQIKSEADAFDQQRAKVRAMGGIYGPLPGANGSRPNPLEEKSTGRKGGFDLNDPAMKKRLLVYGGAALGLYFFLFDDSGQQQKRPQQPAKKEERTLASLLPPGETLSHPKAEMFFKDGFREYTAKNYVRARQQFETVLQVQPTHGLAEFYLKKCDQEIEELVKYHLDSGKKNLEFGRYRQAKGHFETVLRTLYRDQSNKSYQEAKGRYEETLKRMKGEGKGS
ncbi:MAG: FHA domain-containing protein [Bdellovibrionales bacterium]|nr:FHA domain-containing protein [Bdellovibrionales bacterium]